MQQTHFAEEMSALLDLPLNEAFSVEEQEELYAIAYQCYGVGNYANAAQFFSKLVLCNPFSDKFWRGLASSQQMQQHYLAAVHAWSSSALLDANDPLPHFHAAECLFSLNEKEEALKALQAAESLLTHNKSDPSLKSKIHILKQVHSHA